MWDSCRSINASSRCERGDTLWRKYLGKLLNSIRLTGRDLPAISAHTLKSMIGQGFYSPVSSLKSCKWILLIHKRFVPAIMARRSSTLSSDEMSLSKSATRITVLMSMFEKQLPRRTGSVYIKCYRKPFLPSLLYCSRRFALCLHHVKSAPPSCPHILRCFFIDTQGNSSYTCSVKKQLLIINHPKAMSDER